MITDVVAVEVSALTPRQQAVLAGVREGASNSEIAEQLGVSVETVRDQLKAIREKAGPRRRIAWIAEGVDPATVDLSRFDLNLREEQVVRLILEGLTNREIGCRLYLATETVKGNVRSALRKLGARNRYDAVYMVVASASHVSSAP